MYASPSGQSCHDWHISSHQSEISKEYGGLRVSFARRVLLEWWHSILWRMSVPVGLFMLDGCCDSIAHDCTALLSTRLQQLSPFPRDHHLHSLRAASCLNFAPSSSAQCSPPRLLRNVCPLFSVRTFCDLLRPSSHDRETFSIMKRIGWYTCTQTTHQDPLPDPAQRICGHLPRSILPGGVLGPACAPEGHINDAALRLRRLILHQSTLRSDSASVGLDKILVGCVTASFKSKASDSRP